MCHDLVQREPMHAKPTIRSTPAFGVVVGLAMTLGAACTSESDGVNIPGVDSPANSGSPASVEANPQTASATTEPLDVAPESTPQPTDAAPTRSTTATTSSPAPAPAPPAESPATTVATVFYRQGDEGPEVGVMQLKLITLGYLAQGAASSVFDAATEAALRKFQNDYALGVDGIFGPLTNRSLTAAANSVDLEPG
jgi:peptidoglycan hydrolase-like protein with peptidoglycan-binding domain